MCLCSTSPTLCFACLSPCVPLLPWQAEGGSLPRPGVSGDADKLLELVAGLAAKQSDKVEVDEALLRKFASGQA